MGRIAITSGYPVALAVTSAVAASRPPAVQEAWLGWASTNLDNLHDHPVRALAASAFLTENEPVAWVVLAAVGLGAAGWVLGFRRTAVLVIAAHAIGTVVSEGLLAELIRRGERLASDRQLTDVGASYIVVCALVAGLVHGRWPGRVLAGIGLAALAPGLFDGLVGLEVAAVGHLCAVVVALVGGWVLTFDQPAADPC